MTSSSMLEPPFRMGASEIASLWSEETGRSAFEIREDLETWLEDFGREDTLSRDDKFLWLMGVRRVDRVSLLTYCRNRGLEFPEFWFSDTIAREKSTGRRSDGPEPDHNAFSGSYTGSDGSFELSPTTASESPELVGREELVPGGENTDEYINPGPAADQPDLIRITKARLASSRLFIWGPALIVAFGVALVGWRYWPVDVEYREIASENVQETASQRIEKGPETQTSKEMAREDQYRTDRAFLESQSRTGIGAAAVKPLSFEMTQDELSIAPENDRPAALDAQSPQAETASSAEDRYEVWAGETRSEISILTPKDRQSGWKESQVRKPHASEREGLGEKSLEKVALPFSTASSPTAEKVAAEATVVTAALGEGEDIETAVFVEAEMALPLANPPQEEGLPNSRLEHFGPWHNAKETDLPDDILVYLIQKQLNVHDLYSGEMAGTLTYDTRTAIQSYQISYGIVPDGEVSKELLRHLAYQNLETPKRFADEPRHKESTARSRSEMSISQTNKTLGTTRGNIIRRTQEMLSAAGIQAGPLDGILGQQTKSAIVSYQWAYDLPTDGLPSVELLNHIEATIYLEGALRKFSLGEFREASRSFSRLLKLRPDDADVYFNRGLAFKNSDNLVKASEDFHAAIEINPAHTKAHFNLANVHYRQGKYGAALGNYGRIVQLWLQGR